MDPTFVPLTITRGIKFGPVTFTLTDANDAPTDLDGFTPFAHARKTPEGPLVLDLHPSVTAPGVVTIPSLSDEETLALKKASLNWDLVFEEDSTGERFGPYFAGSLEIESINTHA